MVAAHAEVAFCDRQKNLFHRRLRCVVDIEKGTSYNTTADIWEELAMVYSIVTFLHTHNLSLSAV